MCKAVNAFAGQHLLSAVVEQIAGADTLSWELHPQQQDSANADTVTIDLSVPSLTPKQMSDIEDQCNAHIRAAHNIRQIVLDNSSQGQAERKRLTEKANLRGKLPPADVIQVLPVQKLSCMTLNALVIHKHALLRSMHRYADSASCSRKCCLWVKPACGRFHLLSCDAMFAVSSWSASCSKF